MIGTLTINVPGQRNGVARPSLASDLVQRVRTMDAASAAEEEDVIKNTAAVAYAGGADTVRALPSKPLPDVESLMHRYVL